MRRPLTSDQKRFFIDRQFQDAKDPVTGAKRVVLLALKSPRFLYHGLDAKKHTDHEVASRVSFALWDSLPDERLRAAAASGQLHTRPQVEQHVRRMLVDGRARSKFRDFLHRWLDLERTHSVVKDKDAFPDFNNAVLSDLRVSLDLFLDDVVWSDASDYRRLLSDQSMYVNGRLAKFYGIELAENADFQKVELTRQARSGVLSHPLLMAGFA